ncbi:MAG: hypothetical protein IKE14_06895 [Loktanella sp.]|jgi:hypothetical protein|nr:hypothetical protein [Loktanella sp.]
MERPALIGGAFCIALAVLRNTAYITLNSGVLASTPKAPPGNINGPRARFFMLGTTHE